MSWLRSRRADRANSRVEDELHVLREAAKAAKTAYDEAIFQRSEAARDVNALLERKHSWTDADVTKFTALVRSDHSSNHMVSSTSLHLKEAETNLDKAFSSLTQAILERYHEEQVWSDKIRSVSTWANVVALVINVVVFVGAIAVVEPWKRRRLVEGLERRTTGMMERVENGVAALASRLDDIESHADRFQLSAPALSPAWVSTSPSISSEGITPVHNGLLPPRPRWITPLPWLPSALAVAAEPSFERDLAAVGVSGALVGVALATISSWLIRGR